MTPSNQKATELKTSTIVALYNAHAEKPVTKFADRATAETRIAKLIEDKGLVLMIDGDTFSLVEKEPDFSKGSGNEIDPLEDTEKTVRELSDGSPEDEQKLEEKTDEQKPLAERIAEAAAARKAAAAAKKPAKKGGRRGPAGTYADTAKITVVVTENPKKAGTASHTRFAVYKTGMTVAEFLKAGGKRADLDWDVSHKFVSIA